MNEQTVAIPPMQVWKDLTAGWRSFALAAAIDLDVFTHINDGRHTAAEIASAAAAKERGIGRLCDAMTALGYLRKQGGRYDLEPIADTYLVRGREFYMENQGMLTRGALAALWSQLPDLIRSGKPAAPQNQDMVAQFFRMLVKAIFPTSYIPAKTAAASLSADERSRIRTILDVAAGSAAWSMPFAQSIPQARVTALDFPQVLEVTREFVDRYKLSDRYDFVAGDMNELDFGAARFDLVILGHIVHGLGRELARKLIGKAAAALRKGGMLLIAEFVANDERSGPDVPMLFGLNMLANTEDGDVYTMAEYRQWLRDAGMTSIRTIEAPQPSPLILATKG